MAAQGKCYPAYVSSAGIRSRLLEASQSSSFFSKKGTPLNQRTTCPFHYLQLDTRFQRHSCTRCHCKVVRKRARVNVIMAFCYP
eukprot:7370778-Pyramimonas_sp.AAC.1